MIHYSRDDIFVESPIEGSLLQGAFEGKLRKVTNTYNHPSFNGKLLSNKLALVDLQSTLCTVISPVLDAKGVFLGVIELVLPNGFYRKKNNL